MIYTSFIAFVPDGPAYMVTVLIILGEFSHAAITAQKLSIFIIGRTE